MAIATAYFNSDLDAMIADLPCTGRFPGSVSGTEFTCAATELSTEESLLLSGNDTQKAIRIVFASDAFTVTAAFKPQSRLQLKYPSQSAYTNYEIVGISLSPDLVSYEVTLKADNRAS